MKTTYLKELPLNALVQVLIGREKLLDLSKKNRADNRLIQFNKQQLTEVEQVIIEKTGCELPLVLQAF